MEYYLELILKYKILTACVAAALLAGCGDDDGSSSFGLRAFDGAIMGMAGTYKCTTDDGTETTSGTMSATDYYGDTEISDLVVEADPSQCSFTFNATDGAIDVSNGKDMSDVSYSIPRGLLSSTTASNAETSASAIATAFSSMLTDGASDDDIEDTLNSLLSSYGVTVSDILDKYTNYSSARDLLNNWSDFIEELENDSDSSTLLTQLTATAQVLTDVQTVYGNSLTADEIATVTSNLTSVLVDDDTDLDSNYLDVIDYLKTVDASDAVSTTENLSDEDAATLKSESTKESEPVDNDDGDTTSSGSGSGSGSGTSGGTGGGTGD